MTRHEDPLITARLVDGADEVHIYRTGRRILSAFERGEGYDFGDREGEVAHISRRVRI